MLSMLGSSAHRAEARMDGDDQTTPLGQRQHGVEAGHGARAVEVHERLALAGGEDRRVDSVDVEVLLAVLGHLSAPPPRR